LEQSAVSNKDQVNWFKDIESIVSAPLNFKAKLAIGEDAYTALRVKNAVVQVWDVAGVATTAAVVAKSSVVASTFFAPTGFWAALGIGSAVTPVGWVIAAGVVTGGAWYGITRHLKSAAANRVTVVPNFINTPLDVLALGLFDLLVPLAMKVAEVDGRIDESRRQLIRDYFVKEWGYDPRFVVARDCNFKLMAREILGFLRNIVEVDGRQDRHDEQAIENIEAIFAAANRFSVRKKLRAGLSSIRHKTGRILLRRKPARDKHKS
jgi:hypothetical protein